MFEAIIAAVAGVLGAGLGSWATVRASRQGEQAAIMAAHISREPRKADLEVVDISCVTTEELDSQDRADLSVAPPGAQVLILDVKLRNSGGETAFVHKISLCVRDVIDEFTPTLPQRWDGRLDDGVRYSRVGTSERDTYDLKFGQEQRRRNSHYRRQDPETFIVEKNISQEVRPGEIDRFLVRVWDLPLFFCADATITYNASQEVKSLQGLKCLQPSPRWWDVDSMLRALSRSVNELTNPDDGGYGYSRQTRTRHGQFWVRWQGEEMPINRALWRCVAGYESFLQKLSDLYVEVGREVNSEFAEIQQAISDIPRIRHELGLERDPE